MSVPHNPHKPASTDAFYSGLGVHPESGRVTSPVQDVMSYGSKAGGFLSDAFNWTSGFMDQNPVFTKWAVGGLAFLGLMQVGLNRGWLTMLGDNFLGKAISLALIGALAFGAGSFVGDWAANKGADQRAVKTGKLENTATVPAQEGTSGAFNGNALGRRADALPLPDNAPKKDNAPDLLVPAPSSGPG